MRSSPVVLALAVAGVLLLLPPGAASAAPASDLVAPAGCAMSHCDSSISGNAGVDAPTGPVDTLWHDRQVTGSGLGLGCSSNLSLAVCSFAPGAARPTSLRAYRPDGSVAWSSSLLNASAIASAPIVAPDGSTIAADDQRAVRIAADGTVLWNSPTPGGTPISPNLTADGRIVLATAGGPVSVLDSDSGQVLSSTTLEDTVEINGRQVSGSFDTINTPAVRGSRVYVSTQFRSDNGVVRPFGRLYALDVTRAGGLRTAWTYDFAAPSGSSPLAVTDNGRTTIVFDGRGTTAGRTGTPNFMGVRDEGSRGRLVWSHDIDTPAQAAASADPRGGAWVFAPVRSKLLRLDTTDGSVLQTLDVDALTGAAGVAVPSSTLTITGPASRPVMLLTATPVSFISSYLLAIDLTSETTLWKERIDDGLLAGGVSYGQFPILEQDGKPRVVFTTAAGGARAVG